MARIAFSSVGATPFEKLVGHNPLIQEKWSQLEAVLFGTSHFGAELKEQVRRTLAFGNGCEYCMDKGRPDDVQTDARISLAVAFAQIINQNHKDIDDRVFDVLRTEFTEEEIAELTALICFITASQMLGAVMDLQPGDGA
ncbi:MAG: carboxymuconolactone decarboxylase family protein [Tumebacillaceae bacterium]